ncbi:putative transcriptional regulatory protein (plasmid) [Mycolicibacterium alvei]|uniref:Putative transcriptional regulatory protein n=2 Tax=Mycobacteriaceae TaxID=1762 RepID=A0A6N4V3Z0_9MYCO|nr:putative transcriptional regulatory protein [Mycolicibacterium alvei]
MTLLDTLLTILDMQLVRGSSLTGFAPLVTAHGGDPDVLLALAGVDAADAGCDDRFIPLRSAIAAVETAATLLGVPDFGRQLGRRQSIDILGPVSVAARTAATVAEALDVLVTHMDSHSPAISACITTHAEPELRRFEYDFQLRPAPPQGQALELALGLTLQVLRLFLGTAYRPVAVHLPHSPLAADTDYHEYFGCPPHFNDPIGGFTLRASDLQRPLNHDPLAHRLALAYLSDTRGRRTPDIADTVGSIIRQLLPTGELSAEQVARQFGIHAKTLQRRLVTEGTSYAELVDRTRRELTHRLLTGTDLPVAQVSRQLGYAEQSVFTRASKRWFGVTPTTYRQHPETSRRQSPPPE